MILQVKTFGAGMHSLTVVPCHSDNFLFHWPVETALHGNGSVVVKTKSSFRRFCVQFPVPGPRVLVDVPLLKKVIVPVKVCVGQIIV